MLNFVAIYRKDGQNAFDLFKKNYDKCLEKLLFKTKLVQYINTANDRCTVFFTDEDLISSIVLSSKDKALYFFSGCLLRDENIFSDIKNALEGYQCKDPLREIGAFRIGKLTLDKSEDFFYQGILSHWGMYYGKNKDTIVISDNPYLASILVNGSVEFNYEVIVRRPYLYGDIGSETVYKNVYMFPSNALAQIDTKNNLSFRVVSENLYQNTIVTDWLKNVDEAYESMLKTTKAIAKTAKEGHKLHAQLTGGFDSRLTLALALATNTEDKFEFNTYGITGDVSSDIADVRTVKLIQDKFPKLDIIYHKISEFLNLENSNVADDLEQIINLTAATSYGPNLAFATVDNIYHSQMQYELNGGLSEVTCRSNHSMRNRSVNGTNMIINVKNSQFKPTNKKPLLTKEANNRLASFVTGIFNKIPSIYDFDILFSMSCMLQSHVGILYRNTFSPVFNSLMHHCNYTCNPEYRAMNGLIFKLMRKANKELTKIPFAGKRWDPLVYLNLDDAKDYSSIPRIERNSNYPTVPFTVNYKRFDSIYEKLFDIDEHFYDFIDKSNYLSLLENKDKWYQDPNDLYDMFFLGSMLLVPTVCKKITFAENASLQMTELDINKQTKLDSVIFNKESFGFTSYDASYCEDNNLLLVLPKDHKFYGSFKNLSTPYKFNRVSLNPTWQLDMSLDEI